MTAVLIILIPVVLLLVVAFRLDRRARRHGRRIRVRQADIRQGHRNDTDWAARHKPGGVEPF